MPQLQKSLILLTLLLLPTTPHPSRGTEAQKRGTELQSQAAESRGTEAQSRAADFLGTEVEQNQVTPIFLVPGLWYKYSSPVYGRPVFARFISWLVESGFPREHIYVLDYDSTATLSYIHAELNRQLDRIIGKYPSSTKFDFFAHSLGGFVGLYAIMEGQHGNRFRKFVSLAGIPQGWDGYGACKLGLCGLAHPPLIPYRSSFVIGFLNRHAEAIAALDKCSLFSPHDGLVRPYDAGRFEDGTNVELEALTHMDMVFSRRSFDAVVNSCYHGHIAPE